jgi:ferrous iron transport protein A
MCLTNSCISQLFKLEIHEISEARCMTLDKLPIGKDAKITAVGGQGTLRLRLLDMGLIPGTRLKITRIAPMGDPVELLIRGYRLSIRLADAKTVEVEVL